MANQATTNYKVTGTRKAVSDLWAALQGMNVNTKNIWLDELAKYYGIDYEAKHISVRGHIYWAEFEEDDDHVLLSFDTESAWDACNELFEEINHLLWDEYHTECASVAVKSSMFMMKALSLLKNVVLVHTESHLTKHVRMSLQPSRMPSRNGLQRPA